MHDNSTQAVTAMIAASQAEARMAGWHIDELDVETARAQALRLTGYGTVDEKAPLRTAIGAAAGGALVKKGVGGLIGGGLASINPAVVSISLDLALKLGVALALGGSAPKKSRSTRHEGSLWYAA
jgi:hypothetical protein